MRFGHFFYPMNFDPSRDHQAIEDCLQEAELVEELGFDAIWIAEHHFIGEAIYGAGWPGACTPVPTCCSSCT